MLVWCGLRGYNRLGRYIYECARKGDVDACRRLRKAEGMNVFPICPLNDDLVTYAAKHGQMEVVKYLHENGCPWNEETCTEAAMGGRLDVLKNLHKNGCPWNGGTCVAAAKGGHLDVLKYAHKNGCPWRKSSCRWVAGAIKFVRRIEAQDE